MQLREYMIIRSPTTASFDHGTYQPKKTLNAPNNHNNNNGWAHAAMVHINLIFGVGPISYPEERQFLEDDVRSVKTFSTLLDKSS